jgi:hypothetical protein
MAGVASVQHQLGAGLEAIEQRRNPHVTLLHRWCRGVQTAASIVVRVGVRVRVSGGSGGLRNKRITEGMQRFILARADRCPMSSS